MVARPVLSLILSALLLLSGIQRAGAAAPYRTVLSDITTRNRVVALSFDDGPSPYTAPILRTLTEFGAHATFFEIGEQVAAFAPTVRAIVRDGDEIGDHTWTHPDLVDLTDQMIRGQIEETNQAIHAVAGVEPTLLRPPYGEVDSRVVDIAASLGMRTVLWSVDPRDWALPGTGAIVENVLTDTRPGSIILLHDGGGDRSETVAALPTILRGLRDRGYRVVTVSTLFNLPFHSIAPACSPRRAEKLFTRDGMTATPAHAIYTFWFSRYCSGANLGPATSGEYAIARGIVAQDFRRTAHRLEWDRSTGAVRAGIVWPWAVGVFNRRGIQPQLGTPLTHAWFAHFLRFHNWGPALTHATWRNGGQVQCFAHGCAVAHRGRVVWHPKHRSNVPR